MPNSILGLIFLVMFLMPGFFLIIEVRRKEPLFAAGQPQTEFILWSSLAGLACHVILITISLLVCCAIVLLSDKVTFLSVFGRTFGTLVPKDMNNAKIWHIFIVLSYCVLVFTVAKLLGIFFTNMLRHRGLGLVDFSSPWLDTFSNEQVNFVSAHLDNGYIVTGIAESIQSDSASLISGNRDMVISSVRMFDPNGIEQDEIADRITINTRNIKMLQIAN